jgi:outer membrane protein assembly factor BamB
MMLNRALRSGALSFCIALSLLMGGCQSLSTWLPTWVTSPSWPWSDKPKVGPLPPFEPKATARIDWRAPLSSKASAGFAPVVRSDAVYGATPQGELLSVDPATGRQNWRTTAAKVLSGGIGAQAALVAVGTDKAQVLAFDTHGGPLWTTKISSEVVGPPQIAEGMVVVWSLDGRIFGLSSADGSRKWIVERTVPPLTVRKYPGGIVTRGGLFVGTAGGKLLAIDVKTGALGWEGSVTTARGATELERLADVTSLPVVDSRQVCAAAYLGRVACFDITRGTLIWQRDFGSLSGIAMDNRFLFITDDKSAIQALDKNSGASAWKQDKLALRSPGGPVVVGDYLGVVDVEGYLHLLDRGTGALVGRLATDGEAPVAQPIASGDTVVWQSAANLISASVK